MSTSKVQLERIKGPLMLRWRFQLGMYATAAMAVAWVTWWEPASLRVSEYRLDVPAWPAHGAALRIALISDLHVGSPFNGLDKLRRVVAETNEAHPDLVLLAGDFVILDVPGGHFVPPEPTADVLRGLTAPLGVYAVLGNHDWWFNEGQVARALSGAGIHVLEQQATKVSNGEHPFWLVGVGDFFEGAHDVKSALAQVTDADPVFLFTHNPDVFPDVPSRVSLTMAGHTHGGQVYFPFVGRLVVPSIYGERFAIGHVVEEGRHLFVTPGVGTSVLPVRFLVPPEISLLILNGVD